MHIPEEELTTANGETKILQTIKIPYKTNGGGTDAVLLYARDITALKQYEQQLETQRITSIYSTKLSDMTSEMICS